MEGSGGKGNDKKRRHTQCKKGKKKNKHRREDAMEKAECLSHNTYYDQMH